MITGFDLPEGNIHSPNERLRVDHIPLAVEAGKELFRAFASLRWTRGRPQLPPAVRAVRLAATDKRIPRPLRWLARWGWHRSRARSTKRS